MARPPKPRGAKILNDAIISKRLEVDGLRDRVNSLTEQLNELNRQRNEHQQAGKREDPAEDFHPSSMGCFVLGGKAGDAESVRENSCMAGIGHKIGLQLPRTVDGCEIVERDDDRNAIGGRLIEPDNARPELTLHLAGQTEHDLRRGPLFLAIRGIVVVDG